MKSYRNLSKFSPKRFVETEDLKKILDIGMCHGMCVYEGSIFHKITMTVDRES